MKPQAEHRGFHIDGCPIRASTKHGELYHDLHALSNIVGHVLPEVLQVVTGLPSAVMPDQGYLNIKVSTHFHHYHWA
jgi:hypothetical protein